MQGKFKRSDERSLGKPALLCIDLQFLGAIEGYGIFEKQRQSGISKGAIEYYLDRVWSTVIPNVVTLQRTFREMGQEIIHSRIQSLTQDGRDRSWEHKRLGLHAAPGSKLAEFLPDVAPQGDELIINKTASGLFNSTNIHYVMRNLDITDLLVAGVYTNECVSSAVRSAADLGYNVTLLSDATAAITPELHRAAILTVKERYARVSTTKEAIEKYKGALATGRD
ncbi:cysteine hydrolase family protein [Kangiella shandongensis]|uniref:cysteine hydrolase family protein n=1 Tax=Kangiella shandongensis TaxID=2763258 RepID=UPI0038B31443